MSFHYSYTTPIYISLYFLKNFFSRPSSYLTGTARKSSPVTTGCTLPALMSNMRAQKSSARSSGASAFIVTPAA